LPRYRSLDEILAGKDKDKERKEASYSTAWEGANLWVDLEEERKQ
jgi:hypothetical protein